ncbi:MAG: GAF domain-containing protein [Anaerolineae bacterium]|nr:GAF domain-containing protein [Anaerolineae bacterium]
MMSILEENKQTHTSLKTIQKVSQAISRIRNDRKRLLKTICDIIVLEQGYETVWIGEFRHEDLYPSVASSNTSGQSQELKTWIAHAPFNPSAAEEAIRQKRAIVTEHRKIKFPNTAAIPWITAAVPIFVDDEVTAILNACTLRDHTFDEQEIQLLEELAVDIGFALESMELENRRREAEDALRISEGRFRRLSENSLVGIVLIQHDLLRYVNPALTTMFGYENPEAMIDKLGPLDLVSPAQRKDIANDLSRILNTVRGMRFTFKGVRQDGSLFDVEAYGGRTIHARRPAIIATVLDISDRERAHRQLESLSEAGLTMSRVRDPEQALQTAVQLALNIVPGNAANIYLLHHGIPKRAVEAGYQHAQENTARSQTHPHTDMPSTFHRMIETRAPLLINDTAISELWRPHPSSKEARAYLGTPLIVRGEIIGFLSVDSWDPDCFAEEDAQHLQRFGDYVAATVEHLRLIASLEAEQQRLTLLNQLSHALSETLEPEEVAERALTHIGQELGAQQGIVYIWDQASGELNVLSGQSIQQDRLPLNATANNTLARWVAQNRQTVMIHDVTQDSRWLPAPGVDDWAVSALDVPLEVRGELIGVLSLLSDQATAFSENDKQLLEALSVPVALALQNARFYQAAARQAKLMTEALRHQEELDRMKDELVQNISHELRTPLALILGYAAMLQEGALGAIAPGQTEAIEIITRRSLMLRTLVENMTMLWQVEAEKEHKPAFEIIDLCEFTSVVVEEFQNQGQKLHIAVEAHTGDSSLLISGIPLQIHRILDNLIGNALKFTPDNGCIKVEVCQKEQWACLSVSDNGIGVPQEKLEKIFERFYQVDGSSKRRYGGTGLGLALVKSIAESHQGTVYAESPVTDDPEHPGTRITVLLPLYKA